MAVENHMPKASGRVMTLRCLLIVLVVVSSQHMENRQKKQGKGGAICQKKTKWKEVRIKMSDPLMRDTAERASKENDLSSSGKQRQARKKEARHRKKYPRKIPGMRELKKQRKR